MEQHPVLLSVLLGVAMAGMALGGHFPAQVGVEQAGEQQ